MGEAPPPHEPARPLPSSAVSGLVAPSTVSPGSGSPSLVVPGLDTARPAGAAPERTQYRGGSRLARVAETVRLVHPFPSLLDGLVVGVVALVAGAAPSRAGLLGGSTVFLQFAIGTLNDLVDAPRDSGTRTGKPMADGLVGELAAKAVLAACVAAGLLLALSCGPAVLAIAGIGLAIGLWYDLGASGTRFSWLPIALGVPLLPVYGWFGATGGLPSAFTVIVPAAAIAGAGLAIANSVVDLERDVAAGSTSLSVSLGARRATGLVLLLQVVVAAIAIVTCGASVSSGPWADATLATAIIPVAGALIGVIGAKRGPNAREVAFEVQAVGLGLLAVAWVNALGAAAA